MGSEQALDPGIWVDRYGDCLYRYALLRVRTAEAAADVVQETFLEAFRTRGSFAGRSNERTWLIGILRHKIIDHFRKAKRERTVGDVADPEQPAESPFDHRGHWRVGPSSWGGDPSRALETREFWETIETCLSRLPARLATAFCLRELDGLDAVEVERLLEITPANLWARLHRARSLLRQCLETRWYGRGATRSVRATKGSSPP